jgi:Co/Zn/Cd efflux system component
LWWLLGSGHGRYTAWPDPVVAVIISGLVLQSSWTIIRHAISDFQEAKRPAGKSDPSR